MLPDLIRGLAGNLAAHAVHGGISTDIGQIVPRVALGQVGQLLEIDVGLHLHALQPHAPDLARLSMHWQAAHALHVSLLHSIVISSSQGRQSK